MTPTVGQLYFYYPHGATLPSSVILDAIHADNTVLIHSASPDATVYDNVGVSPATAPPVDSSGFPNGCISDIGVTNAPPVHRR